MLFSGLADRLQGIFKNLRGRGRLSESDVNECLREIRLALLEADVNFKVVKDFVARVKVRAVGQDVLEDDAEIACAGCVSGLHIFRAFGGKHAHANHARIACDRTNGKGNDQVRDAVS